MAFPKIPTGPFTLAINGLLIDGAVGRLAKDFLPAYELEETSGYRNAEKNKEEGGAEWSSHMYNLAKDFVLKEKNTGRYLSPERLKQVYKMFVKPNWDGYSVYNPPKTGTTGWIHVNLDREITNKTRWADYTVAGISVALGVAKIIKKLNYGKKRNA